MTIKASNKSLRSLLGSYVEDGQYHFTTVKVQQELGKNIAAVRASLRRSMEKNEIAMPYKGFWVIVPPEYRRLGCLPAQEFVPQLMEFLGENYHAGLLTAAQFHGVAPQQPQVFQVVVSKNRPDVICGKIRVNFIARKQLDGVPTMNLNTARGTIRVSTVEATALELVGYPNHCGGMDNVASIVAGLAEKMDATVLQKIAKDSPLSWVQRLGFLLEEYANTETAPLRKFIEIKAKAFIPLVPGKPIRGAIRNKKWNLLVNEKLEPDL